MSDQDVIAEALTMDANRSTIVLILGMKGRGKSAAARMLFDAWPADRVVIDPTGDARPDDPATIAMTAPFPSQLPEPELHPEDGGPPQTRVTVWARINPGSETLQFDQDQAMGMALHPRRKHKLIWRDEFGLGVSPQTTLANDRTLLMSSRHYNASALLVTPRPRFIPTLAISQSDKVLMFALPNPKDREHIADNAGIPTRVIEREYAYAQRELGHHAFLLIDRRQHALLACPPLPGITARGPAA